VNVVGVTVSLADRNSVELLETPAGRARILDDHRCIRGARA